MPHGQLHGRLGGVRCRDEEVDPHTESNWHGQQCIGRKPDSTGI